MKKSSRGFTLVELVIVVAVIIILAAMTISVYSGAQARSRDAKRKADIANIAKALELYYDDNGEYPNAANNGTLISSSWSVSKDSVSWPAFSSFLTAPSAKTGTAATDSVPADPTNNGSPLISGQYSYAYFTGGFCGKPARQWYILVYRYEVSQKEQFTDGDCSTNPLGDSYFNNGASYYRVAH